MKNELPHKQKVADNSRSRELLIKQGTTQRKEGKLKIIRYITSYCARIKKRRAPITTQLE